MENINWSDLSFGYMKTDYNVRCYYRDGKWGELEVSSSEIINIHMAATCLHYGQESFEGLKAFKGRDGKIRVFRMDENGKRMQSSSRGIKMAELPVEKFEEAIRKVVKLNERFVPPYESGAALYIRPLMIGLGAQVGVKPALEYMFMVFVTPVGPYFKGGFKPSKVCIGIRGNSYITPQSHSILPSITNKSLQQLATDMGLTVERRPVPVEEIAAFDEAAECGTAAVIAPISQIDDLDVNKSYVIAKDGKPGPVCEKLYNKLRAIQYGDEPDTYGWITIIE